MQALIEAKASKLV